MMYYYIILIVSVVLKNIHSENNYIFTYLILGTMGSTRYICHIYIYSIYANGIFLNRLWDTKIFPANFSTMQIKINVLNIFP